MDLSLERIIVILDHPGTGLIVIASANTDQWFYSIKDANAPSGYHGKFSNTVDALSQLSKAHQRIGGSMSLLRHAPPGLPVEE